jgi:hypothetical protein
VCQENLVKGNIKAMTNVGKRIRTREVKAMDANVSLNKGLWKLTAETAAAYN